MSEPLHPSSLGEILDRTVSLYRSRFLVFLGIAAIPTVIVLAFAAVFFLVVAWIDANGTTALSTAAVVFVVVFLIVLVLVALPVCLAVTALGNAAMNHAVASAWRDEMIIIRDAYRSAWQRGWSYIGLFLLETLLVWVAPFVAWLVLVFVGAGTAALAQAAGIGGAVAALVGLGAVVAIAALIGYSVWMLLRLSLAFPACVVERISATDAIKRGFSLCMGTRGRILLLYLLGMALNYIVSLVIMVPVLIVIALLPGANNPQNAQAASMVMVFTMYGAGFAIQALTKPIYGIALMLFYYDQRIRKEGYDIEWLMERAGLGAPTPPQAQQLQQFTVPTQPASQESL